MGGVHSPGTAEFERVKAKDALIDARGRPRGTSARDAGHVRPFLETVTKIIDCDGTRSTRWQGEC